MEKFDFSGWATRNNLRCADGRIIRKDAFKENDGEIVPLVWNHTYDGPDNILGHALLENRDEGVYAYCSFNDSESANNAKIAIQHGDINALSIHANRLKQNGSNVLHGAIKEVSLVLAGANPGAFIDSIITHGEDSDEEAIIYSGEPLMLYHSDEEDEEEDKTKKSNDSEEEEEDKPKKSNDSEEKSGKSSDKTVAEVFDTLNEEQKTVVYALIGAALEENGGSSDKKNESEGGGEDAMKHNVFDVEENRGDTLTHDEMTSILGDMKRYGSLSESFLAHADEYGIENIDYLFPDAKNLNVPPEFIQRDTSWVSEIMNGTHHTPFSRIKSMFANITEDEARARGYIKGNQKKEEVFPLLKRVTTPQTIYKKQKLDRDDIIDITDFDVVAWLKTEMRQMLNEEIARAVLISDGREAGTEDKISEDNIRPISKDADLYTIKVTVAKGSDDDETGKNFIRSAIKARNGFKGTGTPTLFTTEEMLTNMLLITDEMGRDLYDSVDKLATKLRVSKIVTVEVMEGATGVNGGELLGIIVNPADYNIGADKGGAVAMFDDFDIDYNQQKYLIETRCSGALIKPYAAIALELGTTASQSSTDVHNTTTDEDDEG